MYDSSTERELGWCRIMNQMGASETRKDSATRGTRHDDDDDDDDDSSLSLFRPGFLFSMSFY